MADIQHIRDQLDAGLLDAELGALLWLMVEVRTPVVAVGESPATGDRVVDSLIGLLPKGSRRVEVAPDDDFEWLPEAADLGWRSERTSPGRAEARTITPAEGVLVARGLGAPGGTTGPRARVVVRALAQGYGLLATMKGGSLEDAFDALHAPGVGTDADERSRLGIVLVVGPAGGVDRVQAAHYVRPVARDTHGHVQRLPPAVLATWNEGAARWDHFAWGVVADLAGRTGLRPLEFEAELARRATVLAGPAPGEVEQDGRRAR